MLLTGIDPGETTGWAVVRLQHDGLEGFVTETASPEEDNDMLDGLERMDVVVVERYVTGSPYVTSRPHELIGAVKYLQSKFRFELVVSEPSTPHFVRKRYGFKKPRLWSQHHYDAFAHVLMAASRKKLPGFSVERCLDMLNDWVSIKRRRN